MQRTDYPALCQAASNASRDGQAVYLRLMKADLVLLVVAAALGSISPLVPPESGSLFAVVAAVAVLTAVLVKLVNRGRPGDRDWFDGRAVAESVKTQTWRYMMRVEPFDDDTTCDAEFARGLKATISARPGLPLDPGRLPQGAEQITTKMREVRRLTLLDRRDFYIQHRLDNQAAWYRDKCCANRTAAGRWFWATISAQFAAISLAIVRIAVPVVGLSLVSFLAALAAALTAWTQVRRNDELSKSYGLAWQELLTVKSQADKAVTEVNLGSVVLEGEGAISREHTMWVAKRCDPLPLSILGSDRTRSPSC